MSEEEFRPVLGGEVGSRLIEAGVVPKNVRRIVIDINMEEAVMVYFECVGDKNMVNLTIENLIAIKKRLKTCPTT